MFSECEPNHLWWWISCCSDNAVPCSTCPSAFGITAYLWKWDKVRQRRTGNCQRSRKRPWSIWFLPACCFCVEPNRTKQERHPCQMPSLQRVRSLSVCACRSFILRMCVQIVYVDTDSLGTWNRVILVDADTISISKAFQSTKCPRRTWWWIDHAVQYANKRVANDPFLYWKSALLFKSYAIDVLKRLLLRQVERNGRVPWGLATCLPKHGFVVPKEVGPSLSMNRHEMTKSQHIHDNTCMLFCILLVHRDRKGEQQHGRGRFTSILILAFVLSWQDVEPIVWYDHTCGCGAATAVATQRLLRTVPSCTMCLDPYVVGFHETAWQSWKACGTVDSATKEADGPCWSSMKRNCLIKFEIMWAVWSLQFESSLLSVEKDVRTDYTFVHSFLEPKLDRLLQRDQK